MIAIGVVSCVFVELFPGGKILENAGDLPNEKRTSTRKNPPKRGIFQKYFRQPRMGTMRRILL